MDYEGSGTDSAASLNYSMQSYANDIVAALQVCIVLLTYCILSSLITREAVPVQVCTR